MANPNPKTALRGTKSEGSARLGSDSIARINNKVEYPVSISVIGYEDRMGIPMMTTLCGGQWWVTSPGLKVQPLYEYANDNNLSLEDFTYLSAPGGKVGALPLAKMLGAAMDAPEDVLGTVLRNRVKSLKRLGVVIDVKDEPLTMDLRVFSNEGLHYRCGKFSASCYLADDAFCKLFDVDAFSTKRDAEEWAFCYFEFLQDLGLDITII